MTRRAHEIAIDQADDLGSEMLHRLLYPGLLLPSRQTPASESFISQWSIRVLVIEDDPYDVDYLQELLADVENASFDFVCANRLATGLAYLAEEDFDVILLDLFLPDSQGLDTFLKACQQDPGVPIVVLTCLDDEGLAMQAVQAGAQDYLTKGHLDGIMLTRAIRYAIERHRLLCALSHQAQELTQANAALVRSNQELNDFSYIAAHDLQEPIRGLRHYTASLLQDYGTQLDEQGRVKLDLLTQLTTRMEGLLNALLQYSRVGQIDFALASTDLNQVVSEVLNTLAVRLQEQEIDIRLPAPLPTVQCDTVHLGVVFHNLLSNAIKYNDKPEKWIELGVTNRGDEKHVFYVRDNGIGIPAKYHHVIFHIFRRLHSRDEYGGGSGAGLTIVKKIIERHGGRIWVESSPGEGTTFYFTLAAIAS